MEATAASLVREALLERFARTPTPHLREQVLRQHQGLAHALARRFFDPEGGEALEDLFQVAMLALVKALERYDPRLGLRFSTFATPAIVGELKRHFRDKAYGIKIPRAQWERSHAIGRATEQLRARLGRSPSLHEVAQHCNLGEEAVMQALQAGAALRPHYLEVPAVGEPADSIPLRDRVGSADAGLEEFLAFADLRAGLAALEAREQKVLRLRFFEGRSQRAVAQRLGLSQMHVSRLQRRALSRLRRALGEKWGEAP
jgi:RNA polymerase sigma-B factor